MTSIPDPAGHLPQLVPPIRRELLLWFRKTAIPLAEAYEGAIEVLHRNPFPGRTRFVAHAVRDICDRLIFVLDPQDPPPRVQYENAMDAIEKEWRSPSTFLQQRAAQTDGDGVTIPYQLASRIDAIVLAHRNRRERPSNQELLLRFLNGKEPTLAPLNNRVIREFERLRRWFMDQAHFSASATKPVDDAELQGRFSAFEGTLHSFVGDFFTGTKELDEILQQANQ